MRTVALRLIELLERDAVPYAVMGGLAVPIWGIPRATFDVDVTLAVDEDGLRRFLDRASEGGFTVDETFRKGFRDVVSGMDKVRLDWWTEDSRRVEVDLFVVSTPYQAAALERRVQVRIEDRSMWVLSAADLILHKLVADRSKDRADVESILLVQGVPDEAYLRLWAGRLGVLERLDRAIGT